MGEKYEIGFFGLGHMNTAILESVLTNKIIENHKIGIYARNRKILEKYEKQGIKIFSSIEEIKKKTKMILLGVKPQNLYEITEELKNYEGVLISILAGIKIKTLEKYFSKIIRVMPNLPLTINEGAVAISYNDKVYEKELDFVIKLFECSSKVEIIKDEKMDNIITVNGSIPAYVYKFIDVLVKDAVEKGIDFDTAKTLITQTFIGASKIIQNSQIPIQEHIDKVCSKGGTTIEAINTMKNQNIEKIIKDANESCIKRAKEIGKIYE